MENNEIEMELKLDNKKKDSKITSINLDKDILKDYCTGKLTNDKLSRMSKSARKICERKLKQLKKYANHIKFEYEEPKKETSKKKDIYYSKESLKHKHDLEIDVD